MDVSGSSAASGARSSLCRLYCSVFLSPRFTCWCRDHRLAVQRREEQTDPGGWCVCVPPSSWTGFWPHAIAHSDSGRPLTSPPLPWGPIVHVEYREIHHILTGLLPVYGGTTGRACGPRGSKCQGRTTDVPREVCLPAPSLLPHPHPRIIHLLVSSSACPRFPCKGTSVFLYHSFLQEQKHAINALL